MSKSGPPFKIVPNSEVTGDGIGHIYVETIPVHPHAISYKDKNKKYIYKHVVVLENSIGRLINPKEEEVHHKNEDPRDNRLSNLILCSKADHARGHAKKKKFWKKSPRNKPSRKSALRVVQAFLDRR
jgi:hypothetical protein